MFHTLASFIPIVTCICHILNVCMYTTSRHKVFTRQRSALLTSLLIALTFFIGVFMLANEYHNAVWDILYTFGYLMLFPTFLLYIKILLEPENIKISDFLHISIPILLTITVCALYGLMTPSERTLYVESFLEHPLNYSQFHGIALIQKFVHCICQIVFLTQLVILVIKGTSITQRYKGRVNDYFSDDAGRAIGYITRFFHILSALIFLIIMYVIFGPDSNKFTGIMPDIMYIILSLFIGISCHYAVMQLNVTDEIYREQVKQNIQQTVTAYNVQDKGQVSLKNQVTIVIEREQLYLKPDLKASELAMALNITQIQLQSIINHYFGTSFSGLINRYRINHAKSLMKEQPNTPIYIIAEMSGYATEMSFYNNFKQITGTTPTNWKRQKGL